MGEQETRKGMEPPSLSGSSFLEVTVSHERWLSLVVRNTVGTESCFILVLTLLLTGLLTLASYLNSLCLMS